MLSLNARQAALEELIRRPVGVQSRPVGDRIDSKRFPVLDRERVSVTASAANSPPHFPILGKVDEPDFGKII